MAFFAKFQRYYLSHFYMMIPLSIILLTCIGSIAVFLITQKGMSTSTFLMMCLSVIAAASYLSVLLAQMLRTFVFRVIRYALGIQLALIVYNLLF